MLFWIASTLLTGIACLAILVPFLRAPAEVSAGNEADLAVYRDQLHEVERDRERGLLDAGLAEQARAEIARRMLGVTQVPRESVLRRPVGALVRALGLAAVLFVPATAWGLYAATGSPDLPGQPLASRLGADPANSTIDELVARAEAHLAVNPADVRGWEILAPIYLRTGRAGDAERAWRTAVSVGGSSAMREGGLGEALVAGAQGLVTADAKSAFDRALAIDPTDQKASYYLALAAAQDGRLDEARERWTALAASLPAGSPLAPLVDQALQETKARAAQGGELPSGNDQSAMIADMVAGLDRRVRDDPADPEGWQRLIRSYVVLGQLDQARDALQRAQTGLAGHADARKAVTEFAASVGITTVE